MSAKFGKSLEIASNVAIVIVAILLGIVLVKKFLLADTPPPLPSAPKEIAAGTKLNLPNVDLSQSDKNLLMVVSNTCHFCSESADFYKRLVQEKASRGGFRMIALLPQPVEQGNEYMQKLGVKVDDVKQVNMSALGVQGTPTLLIVDRNGIVQKSWIGKLSSSSEMAVEQSL